MEIIKEALYEILPVDKERRIEMEVWLVFSARSLVEAKLEELSRQVYDEMRGFIKKIIEFLISVRLAKENLDNQYEGHRLHALIDGMAMHHLLHPDKFTKEMMVNTLEYHLQSLCRI